MLRPAFQLPCSTGPFFPLNISLSVPARTARSGPPQFARPSTLPASRIDSADACHEALARLDRAEDYEDLGEDVERGDEFRPVDPRVEVRRVPDEPRVEVRAVVFLSSVVPELWSPDRTTSPEVGANKMVHRFGAECTDPILLSVFSAS